MTSVPRTARARARAEITAEIVRAGRRQLAQVGPGELSLRAVAREVDMVSSAVYRYFASRDELLTALLIEAYDELGAAAEAADAGVRDRRDHVRRLQRTAGAIRAWAVEHPHDYALLYGSPVRGYVAPTATVRPATRGAAVLFRIVADAARESPGTVPGPARLSRTMHGSLSGLRSFAEDVAATEVGDEALLRAVMAWTTIFGALSFELFGHYANGVANLPAYFDAVVSRLAADLGLAHR